MKKILKPASLLFNFLSLIMFFLVGMYVAEWKEAGKNQGLAGGAIVLGYGVLFAGTAFVASFFMTSQLKHKRLVVGNWLLLLLLLLGFSFTYYRFMKRDKMREEKNSPFRKNTSFVTMKTEWPTAKLISKIIKGD